MTTGYYRQVGIVLHFLSVKKTTETTAATMTTDLYFLPHPTTLTTERTTVSMNTDFIEQTENKIAAEP